jgi:very-short-patch-repair endonuclease
MNKLDTEKFIRKALAKHLGRYSYDKVDYLDSNTKIVIICQIHGEFNQRPADHLSGIGCRLCGNEHKSVILRSNVEEFIRKANLKFQNLYNYTKVDYVNSLTKVTIICNKHGDFEQTPEDHLRGIKCPRCTIMSLGEIQIENFLKKNNIDYVWQKSFKEFRNIYPYRFDFYLPNYGIFIEYDGRQHFIPIKRSMSYNAEENFAILKHNDEMKDNFVKNRDEKMIRIKYTENVIEKLQFELDFILKK